MIFEVMSGFFKYTSKTAQTDNNWVICHPQVSNAGTFLIRWNAIDTQISKLIQGRILPPATDDYSWVVPPIRHITPKNKKNWNQQFIDKVQRVHIGVFMGSEFENDLHYLQCSDHTFTSFGMCRQNSDRIGYRVRKLNSGPGQVITTRNIFVSFSSTLWKVIILEHGQKMLLNKHVIVYEYALCCVFPAATLKDNLLRRRLGKVMTLWKDFRVDWIFKWLTWWVLG